MGGSVIVCICWGKWSCVEFNDMNLKVSHEHAIPLRSQACGEAQGTPIEFFACRLHLHFGHL